MIAPHQPLRMLKHPSGKGWELSLTTGVAFLVGTGLPSASAPDTLCEGTGRLI